jgi:hypothetical protein
VRALCAFLVALHLGALDDRAVAAGQAGSSRLSAGVFATGAMVLSFAVALGLGLSMLLGRQRHNVRWLLALLFFNVLPAVVIVVTGELLGLPWLIGESAPRAGLLHGGALGCINTPMKRHSRVF